jgi:protein-disulfide isomerase
MKSTYFLLAAAAALASSGCNAEKGNGGTSATGEATETAPVAPPASGDWSEVVTETGQGGFLMGNPNAAVKLVEFGSMTCPHCAEFDEAALQPLIDNYIKSGRVSFEFRNFVRDPFDIAASLIARCNGTKSFFPLTRALYKAQSDWVAKIQATPPAQMEALQNVGPDKQFLQIAQLADLQKFAAMRGVPTAKSTQCLTNQSEIDQLVQMNSDATSQYDLPGTPSFLINGKLVENAVNWETLEPKIKEAAGG